MVQGAISRLEAGGRCRGQGNEVNLSLFDDPQQYNTDRDCWATPSLVLRNLERELGRMFTLDVCALPWSAKCPRFYTPQDNGLIQSWVVQDGDLWWLNPPFSDIRPWAAKAHAEFVAYGYEGVMILPSTCCGLDWFHDHVLPFAQVRFLRGRVAFIPP